MTIVDTEEEFDWSAPFDRHATGVAHMRRIGELQAVFERHALRPVYAVGTPIATAPDAVAALQPFIATGRALIGAHPHPWVTPPHDEAVSVATSFPGNLPAALERAKLESLTGQIESAFGVRPFIYKAGRYGIGPNSFAILQALGYGIDISPMPPFDYSHRHGPNFSRRGNAPRWEGPGGTVLSIPNTGAFVGRLARPGWEWLGDAAQSPRWRRARLQGVLARLGLLERIALSPEGYTLAEMCRLVQFQAAAGQRDFMLFLHSPSVAPGCTPYVRTEAEQTAFLDKLDRFLAWFGSAMRGVPSDPVSLRDEMAAARPAPSAARTGKQAMTVQPIQDRDLPEIAAYWHRHLNPAIPTATWVAAFRRGWLPDPPNHGFKLLADGVLVGTLGAIYSRQRIDGQDLDFCNLTSLVVDEAHRARSMDLISACLSQKQFRFTNFTPTESVAKMLRLFRFRELRAGERVLAHAPLPPRLFGIAALERPARLAAALTGQDAKLWQDHREIPWLRSFAVGRGKAWCVVFWKPSNIKGLPAARILGVSDPQLFARWHRAIGGHLLLRHGVFGSRIDEHLLCKGDALGVYRPVKMPRLYRGPELADEKIGFLYSELAALPI